MFNDTFIKRRGYVSVQKEKPLLGRWRQSCMGTVKKTVPVMQIRDWMK